MGVREVFERLVTQVRPAILPPSSGLEADQPFPPPLSRSLPPLPSTPVNPNPPPRSQPRPSRFLPRTTPSREDTSVAALARLVALVPRTLTHSLPTSSTFWIQQQRPLHASLAFCDYPPPLSLFTFPRHALILRHLDDPLCTTDHLDPSKLCFHHVNRDPSKRNTKDTTSIPPPLPPPFPPSLSSLARRRRQLRASP
jgi:hypothetical protein